MESGIRNVYNNEVASKKMTSSFVGVGILSLFYCSLRFSKLSKVVGSTVKACGSASH